MMENDLVRYVGYMVGGVPDGAFSRPTHRAAHVPDEGVVRRLSAAHEYGEKTRELIRLEQVRGVAVVCVCVCVCARVCVPFHAAARLG